MNEYQLVKIWHEQRSNRVKAQLAPAILLALVLYLSATGQLTNNSSLVLRIFASGVVFAAGTFSLFGILTSIRDGVAVIRSLEEIKGLTPLGKDIRGSLGSLVLMGFSFMIVSLFNFVVFCIYIFRG